MRDCRSCGGRSIRSAPIGTQENGGDSIPDETDDRDPAPPALVPRRHPSRVARPPVVAPPAWRWDRWPSGAANPAKRLRALGVTWQALDPWKFEVPVQIGWGPFEPVA